MISRFDRYRRGDVIRFRQGENEYVGTIRSLHPRDQFFRVQTEERVLALRGSLTVRLGSVIGIVTAVLTEKERVALTELRKESRPVTLNVLNGVRRVAGEPLISGTTMRGLAQRGFVVGERYGVTDSGPMSWRLTVEGSDV